MKVLQAGSLHAYLAYVLVLVLCWCCSSGWEDDVIHAIARRHASAWRCCRPPACSRWRRC